MRPLHAPAHPVSDVAPTCRELRHAIAFGELAVWYQPVVELASGLLVGMEALVRWRHPRLGLLGAGQFVPMAESCGVAAALDEWVLGAACRQIAAWQDDVLVTAGFRVAVNVSCAGLDGDALADRVADVIDATGIDPRGLTLELTESAALDDLDAARRGAAALHAFGVELALDDFGAAHSTFARLSALPFDVLKLDLSIVRAAGGTTGDAFARAAVDLAGHLGAVVVAEGIDTVERAERMRELGCQRGQGHLWARALPPSLAERLLVTGVWPTAPAAEPSPASAEHELGHGAERVG